MLQRIQTIWLFLASSALFCLFLFPYVQIFNPDGSARVLKVTGVYQQVGEQVVQTEPFTLMMIATVVVALLPLLIIFLYNDRKKQITVSYISIVIILAYTFWLAQSAKSNIGNATLEISNYGIGVIMPSVAILFIILAIRGIRKDEKLIKSADRLR